MVAGSAALSYSLPIGDRHRHPHRDRGRSYRQTILAYPKGGGAYVVSKDNLGTVAG
jgi:hypothetical protein